MYSAYVNGIFMGCCSSLNHAISECIKWGGKMNGWYVIDSHGNTCAQG